MSYGVSAISSLLGGSQNYSTPSVYDVVTGKTSGTAGILAAAYLPDEQAEALTPVQQNSIDSLNYFVNEFIQDSDKEKLLSSIADLEKMMKNINGANYTKTDPAFALLAGNPLIVGSQSNDPGLLIDALL